MPAHAQRPALRTAAPPRLAQKLDLLCRLGLGLAPIAPDVCAVLRQLVGADAAALFWLDEHGIPEGFFHEDSPASAQNLFLNEFERLFVGEHETNVFALAQPQGRPVGRLLAPDARYFRSNTYNLLVRASGHRHTLDLRVEVQGPTGPVTRAVVALFRAPGRAFGDAEAALLTRALPSLQRAFAPGGVRPLQAQPPQGANGHVVLDAASGHPVLADDAAIALLQRAGLRGLGLQHNPLGTALPPDLLHRLKARPGQSSHLPVPGGILQAQAHALHATPGSAAQVLLTLQLQRPRQIDVVHRVLQLPLTPLQHEIAALAGLGHARADCTARTGVSNAALKKHLATILDVAGASDWGALAQHLRT
ncbi:hypothetical protein [Paenacidovorax monticola]|uniref:HTH luxR-type domain-containing protein n=1 Tax=Paenacidovorax monticola TaxID=1926868 RepID=A0A7H0HDX7_9BURK|nr:hypothetical protein [Paenacidovorax monticola]QNP58743.1 hypothetical protein H9L24_17555 [Paenacidovorax monticola]